MTDQAGGPGKPVGRGRRERAHPVTVLVVDHEPAVLRLLRFLLVTAGYGVLEAHTDEEAITMMEASPFPIDLLLVDLERTDTDHGALVRHARARTPPARVLYMSSLSDQELGRADLAGIAVVHKPVGASALVRRIREFLDEPGP